MIVDLIRNTKTIEVRVGPRGPRGPRGASTWDDLEDKPSTFPPSSHTHVIADTTGLQTALDGKASSSHTHSQGDVTGLTSALAAKADLVDGMVPTNQIPAIAITEFLGSVASQSAMLALTGQRGDWCNRSDVSKAFVLVAEPASTLSNWAAIDYPAAPVLSVNGQSGTVVLGKSDIGLSNVANALQLVAANNLSDLTNAGTARTNLGLGTLATQNGSISDYLTIAAAASSYQPLASPLTAFAGLANASGVLANNGSGTLSYTATSTGGDSGGADAGKIAVYSANGELTAASALRLTSGVSLMGIWFGSHRFAMGASGLPKTWTLPNTTGTLITTGDTGTVTDAMLAGSIQLGRLSTTGTANSSTFLRGDGAWTAIDLTSRVAKSGDAMTGALTINAGTATSSTPPLNITQTFNGGSGVTHRGVEIAITNTSSNSASTLFRVLGGSGGTSERLSIRQDGYIAITQSANNAPAILLTGTDRTASISFASGGNGLSLDSTWFDHRATSAAIRQLNSGGSTEFWRITNTGTAGVLVLRAGSSTGAALQMREMTAPATPAANEACLYFEDNGSGKTRLVVKYDDGSTAILHTQA